MFTPYSDLLIRIYDVQNYVVPPLSILSCTLLVVIVFRHTPRQMGALKWYIIASSLCSLLCEVLVALAHPLPLFPYAYLLLGGVLPALNASQTTYSAYAGLAIFSFIIMFYANSAMFVFRFGQTIDSSLVRWMSRRRYAIGIAVAIISTFGVGILLPANFLTISPDDVRSMARQTDANLFELIKGRSFIGLKLEQNAWLALLVTSGATFLIASSVCIVGSALGCQYFVRFSSRHSHLSERTLRLYRVLANVLVLDLALSLVTIILPGALAAGSFIIGFESAKEITILAFCCVVWYPIATNVLILAYVKPYRTGLLHILRLDRGTAPRISTSSITLFKHRIK